MERTLIDTLSLKSRDFASRWKDLIRKAPQLKYYNDMDDETLIKLIEHLFPGIAHMLDRGLDRSQFGDSFVKLGKTRLKEGLPVSEVIYAFNLVHQVVIEYLMAEYAPENPMRMYQAMGAMTRISEYFILGSFYITKGFLEETYTSMSSHDEISEELLKKYFKDDFFFKE